MWSSPTTTTPPPGAALGGTGTGNLAPLNQGTKQLVPGPTLDGFASGSLGVCTVNGSYLCIVPDGRTLGRDTGVTLPFEGDDTLGVIISKAMLLARDDEITEPSIASQIRGE